MRARDQLIGAVVLCVATAFGLLRIAEAKNEAAAGGAAFRLEENRRDAWEAWERLVSLLAQMGQDDLVQKVGALREDGAIWIAPHLGEGRWAVYVESLRLVRRIYVREQALRDPAGHLFAAAVPDAPPAERAAFAKLSLCGALRHELAHYEGTEDEGAAYDVEIAWYEGLKTSAYVSGLAGDARRTWDWAIESAILSAREARRRSVT